MGSLCLVFLEMLNHTPNYSAYSDCWLRIFYKIWTTCVSLLPTPNDRLPASVVTAHLCVKVANDNFQIFFSISSNTFPKAS